MADNKVIVELNGRLVGDGYTLPIATKKRLGVIKVGEGLDIDEEGVLSLIPIEHNAFSKLLLMSTNGVFKKTAETGNDVIQVSFKPALKVENIDGVPTINLDFGTQLDADKPMSGEAIKEYVNSEIEGLEFEFNDLVDWLASLYVSTSSYMTIETYEVTTDETGQANLPVELEDKQANYVFINGLFAVEGKDYKFADNRIELTSSEFISGNDIVTFVIYKSVIDGKTGRSKPINISSEIFETTTNQDGYSLLPFSYDDKTFQVFVNGVYAEKEKDYSIVNDNTGIQIVNSEFISGNDEVAFVAHKTADGNDIKDIVFEVYETEANKFGRANIPLIPRTIIQNYNSTAVHVYINGLLAVENEDYIIENDNVQLTNFELGSINDVITFVVLKSEISGTVDEEEISVSEIEQMVSEIDGLKDETERK